MAIYFTNGKITPEGPVSLSLDFTGVGADFLLTFVLSSVSAGLTESSDAGGTSGAGAAGTGGGVTGMGMEAPGA